MDQGHRGSILLSHRAIAVTRQEGGIDKSLKCTRGMGVERPIPTRGYGVFTLTETETDTETDWLFTLHRDHFIDVIGYFWVSV